MLLILLKIYPQFIVQLIQVIIHGRYYNKLKIIVYPIKISKISGHDKFKTLPPATETNIDDITLAFVVPDPQHTCDVI